MIMLSFEQIGRLLFSRSQVKGMESRLNAAGVSRSGEKFMGFFSLVILVLAVFSSAIFYTDSYYYSKIGSVVSFGGMLPEPLPLLVLFIVMLIVLALALWLMLTAALAFYIEARRNALETALPDFLVLTAANIKAGMTLDQAMWYGAKPEFGLLSVEVKKAVKRAFSGESLEASLDGLVQAFDSRIFNRTIMLIKQASSTGGEVARVLENTADDARNALIMKKEVAASLILYEIFVLFAGIFGTPFLFAVTGKLIEVFEKKKMLFPATSGAGLPSLFGAGMGAFNTAQTIISSSDFFYFSIAMIFMTSAFSSLIVSVIRTGTKSEGIKYFPVIFALACIVYFMISSALTSLFSTLTT